MKVLGSYIGTLEEGIKRRKVFTTLAMNKPNSIWKSNLSRTEKIRINVVSIFLYGCSGWVDSKSLKNSIDPFKKKIHRLKLVHWPDILRNEECYSIKLFRHLKVRKKRLRMLGHKCRNNPPAKAILQEAL